MSENIVEVDQDQIAEDRFKRWLEHFRECIYVSLCCALLCLK